MPGGCVADPAGRAALPGAPKDRAVADFGAVPAAKAASVVTADAARLRAVTVNARNARDGRSRGRTFVARSQPCILAGHDDAPASR